MPKRERAVNQRAVKQIQDRITQKFGQIFIDEKRIVMCQACKSFIDESCIYGLLPISEHGLDCMYRMEKPLSEAPVSETPVSETPVEAPETTPIPDQVLTTDDDFISVDITGKVVWNNVLGYAVLNTGTGFVAINKILKELDTKKVRIIIEEEPC